MEAQQGTSSNTPNLRAPHGDLGEVERSAIEPALQLLPPTMDSGRARVMLLAAGLQEGNLLFRAQKVPGNPYAKGPARGLWQNERGGVQCVITNVVTRDLAADLCKARSVPFDAALIHARLEFDDVLAAGFARLFLFADPKPLPAVDDAVAAWQTYLRVWRPGKPREQDWPANHVTARTHVMGAAS